MGTFKKGILGGFSGKVGPVVGSSWKGKEVMRSLPKKSRREPTLLQARQRKAFTLVANFLRPVNGILSDYYGHEVEGKTRGNQAMSYHIEQAVVGVMPNLEIDFTKVAFTIGRRLPLELPIVDTLPDAALKISWTDSGTQVEASESDNVALVAYNPFRNLFELRYTAATRSALGYTFNFNANWATEEVHVWIFVTSDDGKACSSSVYLGEFQLA